MSDKRMRPIVKLEPGGGDAQEQQAAAAATGGAGSAVGTRAHVCAGALTEGPHTTHAPTTTGWRRQDFSFRNEGSTKTVHSSCSDSAVEASKEKGEESGGSLHQEGAEGEKQRAATEETRRRNREL